MQKKTFYLIKLKFHFLNNNYICFIKQNTLGLKKVCNKFNIGIIKLNYKHLNNLFKNKSTYLSFYTLLYFNNFKIFRLFILILLESTARAGKEINIKQINMISYLGFFIQKAIIKKINHNFLFYNNNYKIYIFTIHTYINKYKDIMFIIIFKIIYILNNIFLNIKKNF